MHPIIFKIGSFTLRSYGLFIALAVLAGYLVARKRIKNVGLNEDNFLDLLLFLIVGGIIGARLLYILTNDFFYYLNNPFEIIKSWGEGLSFIGIVIAGLLISFIYSKIKKINFWHLLDVLSIGLMLGYSIGRLGCFFNGCCYGLPTNSIIGFRFNQFELFYRLPTQLFTSIGALIIFFILLRIDKKKKFYGKIFGWTLILLGILTFVVELFREVLRFPPLNLSLNQYSTFILIPLGIILLVIFSTTQQIKEPEGMTKFKDGFFVDNSQNSEDENVVDLDDDDN